LKHHDAAGTPEKLHFMNSVARLGHSRQVTGIGTKPETVEPARRYAMTKIILIVDAVINFTLGVLLLLFSPAVVAWFGVPPSSTSFYANILGAIFVGITIALIIGAAGRNSPRSAGLGLSGAISINLCGGIALALWLIFGGLTIPTKGFIFLWALVVILIVISLAELLHLGRATNTRSPR
jgi:hypothetical protein